MVKILSSKCVLKQILAVNLSPKCTACHGGRRHGSLWPSPSCFWPSPSFQRRNSEVVVVPLREKPLFPGFFRRVKMTDKMVKAFLDERYEIGAFLLKNEPGTVSSVVSCIEPKSTYDISGKALYDRLYKIGTYASYYFRDEKGEDGLLGQWRLRMVEMVREDPLIVKVEYLKDEPYTGDDDVIKATSTEVVRTMTEVLNLHSKFIVLSKKYLKNGNKFDYSWLANFGPTNFGRCGLECQKLFAELDVQKRLDLSLEFAKKEDNFLRREMKSIMDFCVIQSSSDPWKYKGSSMKPKRPANAFIGFMVEFRKIFKEKHPNNKSISVIAKAGGEKWKHMTDAEKAPYVAEAESRKIEYKKTLLAFNKKLVMLSLYVNLEWVQLGRPLVGGQANFYAGVKVVSQQCRSGTDACTHARACMCVCFRWFKIRTWGRTCI